MFLKLFVVFAFFKIALFANDGVSLEHLHFCHVDFCINHFLPEHRGSIVLLGLNEKAIEKISKRYPLVEIVPLYFRDKKSWNKIAMEQELEDKFDCVCAANVLEMELDKEILVRLINSFLKPNGRGLIYLEPCGIDSFDGRIERFVKGSKWNLSIQVVSGLSIPEYKQIIGHCGFAILREGEGCFCLYYSSAMDFRRSAGDWICDRLEVSLPFRKEFISDFGDSLLTACGDILHHFPIYWFDIEKR